MMTTQFHAQTRYDRSPKDICDKWAAANFLLKEINDPQEDLMVAFHALVTEPITVHSSSKGEISD